MLRFTTRLKRASFAALLVLNTTLAATTAPDDKFVPPNLQESGRIGCFVEADDGTHEYADAKVFTQYAVGTRPDWFAVMSRRNDAKQLFLDCGKWFYDMAEAFPKHNHEKEHK